MRRTLLLTCAALALPLSAVGGLFAYDAGRGDVIADGVSVGGVDVGGLTPAAARQTLEVTYLAGLERPITVHHDDSTWTLSAREARIAADVDAMVAEAVQRSGDGNALGRSWRRLTGGSVDLDLQPRVTFSDRAVVRLIDRVRKGVERDAKDATLRLSAAGIAATDERRGLKVRASALHREINAAIVSAQGERRFVARTKKITPRVTRKALARRYPVALVADRASFKLRLYRNFKLVKTYGIAVGAIGLETPAGRYDIANKAVNPAWNVPNSDWAGDLAGQIIPGGAPNNPLIARWLGIYDGVGIHGTNQRASIGSNASKGCIRMLPEDVIELYPQVPVGAPIYIA